MSARYDLGVMSHTVTRYNAPTWVNGEMVRGTASTFTVRGGLQPLTAREASRLPELLRTRARWRLYAYTEDGPLRVHGADASKSTGDFVTVAGELCAVIGAEEYFPSSDPRLRGAMHTVYFLEAPRGTR